MANIILWLEDDYNVLDNMFTLLRQDGWVIKPFRTYADFIHLAVPHFSEYKIVVIDLLLPPGEIEINPEDGLLGLNAISYIRNEMQSKIPIIVITGFSDSFSELGSVDEFNPITILQKSVLPSELREAVKKILIDKKV